MMLALFLVALAATGCISQYITDRSNLKVVKSPADENVTVSYREPDGACTTANDSQKQYALSTSRFSIALVPSC